MTELKEYTENEKVAENELATSVEECDASGDYRWSASVFAESRGGTQTRAALLQSLVRLMVLYRCRQLFSLMQAATRGTYLGQEHVLLHAAYRVAPAYQVAVPNER